MLLLLLFQSLPCRKSLHIYYCISSISAKQSLNRFYSSQPSIVVPSKLRVRTIIGTKLSHHSQQCCLSTSTKSSKEVYGSIKNSSDQSKSTTSPTTTTTATSSWVQLATFAAIGTTCLVGVNYIAQMDYFQEKSNSSSNNKNNNTSLSTQPVPPQATVTARAYLDIGIDNQPVGRIVIGLFGDVVPQTVKNFTVLCQGDTMYENRVPLSYRNTPFHRIIPNFMIQSGDFVLHNGTGGRSIFPTGYFPDENFQLQHIGPGVVAMANAGPNTNSSQFYICTAPATPPNPWNNRSTISHLDRKHVVFGTVLDGWDVVQSIERMGSASGKPNAYVTILNCGVLDDENNVNQTKKKETPSSSSTTTTTTTTKQETKNHLKNHL